jgi:ABC-2 type transport system permease protein
MPFSTLFKTYLKYYFTSKRFYAVFPIYIALSAASVGVVVANIVPKPVDVYSYTAGAFGNFVFATTLVAGLFGGDAISRDFGREGLFTLTQPISRSEMMITRFLCVFVVSAVVMLADFFALGFGFSYYFYGAVVSNAAEITGLGVFFIASIVAFALLFSSLFKNPMVAIIVVTIVLWIAMPLVQSELGFANIEPWFFITYAGSVVQDLGYKTYPEHVSTISAGPVSVTLYNPGVLESVAIMSGYMVASLFVAWLVYSRKELREI